MFNGPTFYTSDELAQRARRSQEVARSRDARSSDNFLVSAPNSTVSETDPVAAYPIPEREMANSCGTYAGSCRAGYQEGLHESLIRKTLELQSPDGAAKFKLTMCGADSSVSLPGGAPIVDHLLVRAEAERDWACLMPGLEYIRQHRSPSLDVDTHNLELTLGSSESNAFKTALIFLRKRTKEILETYHVCQLSGDTEAIGINPDVFNDIMSMPPGTNHSFQLAKRGEPARHLTTRFMFGHVGWQISIRLPIRNGDYGARHLTPGTLQPEFWELMQEINSLVGVGITKDLREFADVIKSLYGATGTFPAPIELSTIVRLAGFNLPRHSVQNLAWIFTGALLAKGECSAGDGKWSEKWSDLPVALRCYLSGDVSQVAAVFWLATSAWLMHLFPDVHVVTLVSKMTSAPDLMRWWVNKVIRNLPCGVNQPWTPAETRADMLQGIFKDHVDVDFFSALIPRWPSPVAGGCRYLNTARSYIVDRLPQFRHLDSDMWPPCYKEQYHLFLFGRRGISPDLPPTVPASSPSMAPNPDLEGMLRGPARSLSCGKLGDSIAPGFSLRCRILEYARAYPLEAVKFLSRLEESKEAASRILPYDQKKFEIVWDLRDLLTLLGVPLYRPRNWEDHYPPRSTKEKTKLFETAADLKIATDKKKALDLCSNVKRLCTAVNAGRQNPPPRLDLRSDLKNLLHPKGPGDPSKDEELYLRIGAPIKDQSRIHRNHQPRKRSHSTSVRETSDLRDHLRARLAPRTEEVQYTSPPPRQSPSETATSGEYEACHSEEVTMGPPSTAPRKVHFREYQQLISARASSDNHADEPPPKRSSVAAAAAFIHVHGPSHRVLIEPPEPASPCSSTPWVEPAPVATVKDRDTDGLDSVLSALRPLTVNIRRLFIVGFEQARRLSWGLAAFLPHLDIQFINVPSPDLDGYNTAADELTRYDLSRSYVFAWLYDERCFVQAGTGSGLQISTFDDLTHCPGRVGVISRDQLIQLCDESVHLLHGMQDAVGSTLITPLPYYLINPCCELLDHCTDTGKPPAIKLYCADIVAMTSVVQRWASQKGLTRTSVLCPHLELLIQIRADPWKDWVTSLRQCFGRETTNFSRWGYSQLAKQLWERVEETFAEDRLGPVERGQRTHTDDRGWDSDSSASVRAQSGRRPLLRHIRNRQEQHDGGSSMFKSSNYVEGRYQSPDIDWE